LLLKYFPLQMLIMIDAKKKDIYEKYDVKEYIIIDPVLMNADLYALKDGIYYLHQRAGKTALINSLILPGLSFDLKRMFR
jgi:Uma2 family endonuclease